MDRFIKGILLFGIPVAGIFFYLLDPGEYELFPRCIFYSATGLFCPGCGSQRAIHGMLHLNFGDVARNNLLFLPVILTIAYHYIHPVINKKFHSKLPNILYLKKTPWIVFSIILLFWVFRNIRSFPFSLMAPS